MKDGNYYGIGIENCKTEFNYWTLFRTAQILDADFLFVIGKRFKKHAADTFKCFRHMPVFEYKSFDDFNEHRPYNCPLIGVELEQNAIELSKFKHPKNAIYLLGAEDHGLSSIARMSCNQLIKLHGKRSMNVSSAGSIVLYDRFCKTTEEWI